MTAIPATLVKELRERTGAGMMDCKQALVESEGDLDAAVKVIREKGLAQAAKKAGRETTEGKVAFDLSAENIGAMVAVGCETEPVSNNEAFTVFVQRVLDAVEKDGPEAAAKLETERAELVAKLGENIVVRDTVRYEGSDGDVLSAYVHPPANKLGVLVHARGPEGDDGQVYRLAMHIAASRPLFVRRADVPEAEIDAEREILSKQPDVQEKPAEVREKIVEGRIRKWLQEIVLEEQPWIHDPNRRVGEVLGESKLEVVEFKRLAVAE